VLKHVVDLYVVNSIYISTTNKVVLDKDIRLILVYFWTQRGWRTLWTWQHLFTNSGTSFMSTTYTNITT